MRVQLLPPSAERYMPIALRDVGAHVGFAGADVDDVRLRRRDRDRADRADVDVIEDRLPRAAGIVGSPDAAVHRAEIETLRIPRVARDGKHASAAERADGTPFAAPGTVADRPSPPGGAAAAPSSGSARRSLVRNRTGIILPEWRDFGSAPRAGGARLEAHAVAHHLRPCYRRRRSRRDEAGASASRQWTHSSVGRAAELLISGS